MEWMGSDRALRFIDDRFHHDTLDHAIHYSLDYPLDYPIYYPLYDCVDNSVSYDHALDDLLLMGPLDTLLGDAFILDCHDYSVHHAFHDSFYNPLDYSGYHSRMDTLGSTIATGAHLIDSVATTHSFDLPVMGSLVI